MELKNNKNIMIQEADKVGSVVIMSTNNYFKMFYSYLNDN